MNSLKQLLRSDKNIRFWILFSRGMISLLFIYSGFSKLIQPFEYFQIAIGQYDILPDSFVRLIAIVLPWLEYIGGMFLLLGYAYIYSSGMLIVITGLFQLVLAQALIRRLPMDECGCFGGGMIHLTLYQSFVLDTVIIIALIFIFTSKLRPLALDTLINKDRNQGSPSF